MTEFKVGDVIRNNGNPHYEYGAIGKVIGLTGRGWVRVDLKSKSGYGERNYWAFQDWMELISRPSETPPATITHEGYTYNRGERVRPEWLKDGAWVVRKDNGCKHQVVLNKNGLLVLTVPGTDATILPNRHIYDQYRTHEPKDWKWGDWAMYEGNKVFVMCEPDQDNHIAISGTGMNNSLSNWKFVKPSSLTPTHAP